MEKALKKQYKIHYSVAMHNSENPRTRSRTLETITKLKNLGTIVINDLSHFPESDTAPTHQETESIERVRTLLDSILESDACVFDFTSQGTEIGFLLSYALTYNKPTLVIVDTENRKELGATDFDTTFVSGLSSPYLSRVMINKLEDIENILSEFLNNLDNSHKVKIELSLSAYVNDELEERAQAMGISKSELVRKIFAEELQTSGI